MNSIKNRNRWIPLLLLFFCLICIVIFCMTIDAVSQVRGNGRYYQQEIFGKYILYYVGPNGVKALLEDQALQVLDELQGEENKYLLVLQKNEVIFLPVGSIRGEMKFKLPSGEKIIQSHCVCDLDGNGTEEWLFLTGEHFFILELDKGIKILYQGEYPNLKPWKVQTSDVDGDGKKEISLGVYKKTLFHPVMDKRPYIYDWDGTELVPKWRGSRLAHPFKDYIFQDIDSDGKDEIVALEFLADASQMVQAYRWKGFGFEAMICSDSKREIETIWRAADGKVGVTIRNGMEQEDFCLEYIKGVWKENAICKR
ncbi:hypothetical protein JR334_02980 [Clostridia bacterium]|nr:hypothetical protein JR334_02980 [Clostridia bacterium]